MPKNKQDTAGYYHLTPQMLSIAAERTRAITRQWGAEIVFRPADFMILAESCYMQGMNDMIDAAIRAGWIPDKSESSENKIHFGDLPG